MGYRFALCLLITGCLSATVLAAGSSSLKPQGYLRQWTIIGPFPNPERVPNAKDRGAFDVDYLKSIGGEAKAKIGPNTDKAKPIKLTGDLLDFTAYYTDTDHKLAYAYTEIQSSSDQEALFMLGSDDGVKVWVNGKLVHDNLIQRGANARQDRFMATLHKGTNSILAKVENGAGGWALIMEAYAGAKADQILAEMKAEENSKAFQRQELGLASGWPGYAFWPEWGGIPRIIWRDADTVRALVGHVPLKVRWFDSSLNEVKSPDKPGRYAAYVEGKLKDGTPVRRAMTFFCDQSGSSLWQDLKLQVPYPGKPVDPAAWKERSELASGDIGGLCQDSLWGTQDGAILLAALLEAKATGKKATVTESPQVVNDEFQLALKLKLLGVANKAKPLAEPKKLDKPAPILHEGTLAEAGMKPGAKEKIDALCRQWAEDSGEPFTILVARNGVIITEAAFGKKPDGTPVGLDYRTDVMSITKAITGMLFSQFLDQGYTKLDDSIGQQIPGFPTTGSHMLTYRHLFTHTSGLEGHGEWGGIHNPYLDNVVLDGLKSLHPGRMHLYNGMGYDLAAKAMEYMTGKSIVRLFHDNLFRPMGIDDMQVDDCAYGAHPTARELGILGQWLANHGRYGDKQFISEETFNKLLPEPLEKYYPAVKVNWGIGLIWMPEHKPGTPPASLDPKDLIFSPRTVGHGSASSCILRADLDKNLVVVQIRKTAGPKYAEYGMQFFQLIADSLQ
jgi:CubicO group peptidase (beta-lactamase class C family)